MNETTLNLIQSIANGDAVETEKAFATAMAEKLSVKLDDMRTGLAQNMFAATQETVSEESKKDDEEDEDEDDKKEDDDKDDDEEDKEEMKEGAYTNPGLEALLAKKRAEKAAAVKKTS